MTTKKQLTTMNQFKVGINTEFKVLETGYKQAVESAIKIGNLLAEAKAACDGSWEAWVRKNLSFNRQTADRYAQLSTYAKQLKGKARTNVLKSGGVRSAIETAKKELNLLGGDTEEGEESYVAKAKKKAAAEKAQREQDTKDARKAERERTEKEQQSKKTGETGGEADERREREQQERDQQDSQDQHHTQQMTPTAAEEYIWSMLSVEDIKAVMQVAKKRLMQTYHPDKGGSTDDFKQLQEAFKIYLSSL